MARTPFVQISSSVDVNGESLYALDANGDVWFYNYDERHWEKMPTKRYTGP